jgi:hypothetical protein
MVLDREMETYQRVLPSLLDREGKWVLIKGDQVLGVWDTYDEARDAAYGLCGLPPYLIKQIQEHEKPGWFPGIAVR